MNATATLHAALGDGVQFLLSASGRLKAVGEQAVVEKWFPEIQQHKFELTNLLRDWETVQAAINACCDARRDSDEHRVALLADCLLKAPSDWGWWIHYFHDEACKASHRNISTDSIISLGETT